MSDISEAPPPTTSLDALSVRRPVPKTKKQPKWRPMSYGFAIPRDVALKHGEALYGPGETEQEIDHIKSRYILESHSKCSRLWKTRLRVVRIDDHGLANCIALAENESEASMKLPPKEVIDKMKQILETEEEPKWHKRYS